MGHLMFQLCSSAREIMILQVLFTIPFDCKSTYSFHKRVIRAIFQSLLFMFMWIYKRTEKQKITSSQDENPL